MMPAGCIRSRKVRSGRWDSWHYLAFPHIVNSQYFETKMIRWDKIQRLWKIVITWSILFQGQLWEFEVQDTEEKIQNWSRDETCLDMSWYVLIILDYSWQFSSWQFAVHASQELPAISGLYREEHSQPQNPVLVLVEVVTVTWETWKMWECTWAWDRLSGFGFGFLIWICPKLPDTSWNYIEITWYMKLPMNLHNLPLMDRSGCSTGGFPEGDRIPWGAMQRQALHVG